MNTVTTINWAVVKGPEGTTYTGTRSGWTFVIRIRNGKRVAELSGKHLDGRMVSGNHISVSMAKQAAIAAMHPAEAMAWKRDRMGNYAAQWGDACFRCYRGVGGWMYASISPGTEPVPVDGPGTARMAALKALEEAYGPITPPSVCKAPEGPLADLERALRVAGVRCTPKQLAVVAIELGVAGPV